jgi:hypothetical protein
VFLIVLENKSYENTFGKASHSKLKDLSAEGRLLTNYWGIGHNSLDNYIAMVSGQAPNPITQMDCPIFLDFVGTPKIERMKRTLTVFGEGKITQLLNEKQSHARKYIKNDYNQLTGVGCVYPKSVLTIADQLEQNNLTWRAYMQDMKGNCRHPKPGHLDITAIIGNRATYTPRHNPFVYFHSLIGEGDAGHGSCDDNDRPLGDLNAKHEGLAKDLEKGDIANVVFISPNLCNDGHTDCIHSNDKNVAEKRGDEMAAIDSFVPQLVGRIMQSPVYKESMVIITFDEAEVPKGFYYSPKDEEADEDTNPAPDWAHKCCDEQPGPMWNDPGIRGPGGGKVGAIVISPFIKNNLPLADDHQYNHYALLRTIEDLFNLGHLGFAGQAGLNTFQTCGVFDQVSAGSAP